MTTKWTKNGRVEFDYSKHVKGTGSKKFIKSRQCAAQYTKGGRAGFRCSWYAQEGSAYCVKHNPQEGVPLSKKHADDLHQGARNWWARVKALEAKHPGIMRQILNSDQAAITRLRVKEIQKVMPKPQTDDKQILQAHKIIVRKVADLPAVPDKPFDKLEPHEQLTVITGQSLKVVHEILSFSMKDADGLVDAKIASMVKDTALRALAVRVKVDRNALAAKRLDKMSELLDRLKAGEAAKTIEG